MIAEEITDWHEALAVHPSMTTDKLQQWHVAMADHPEITAVLEFEWNAAADEPARFTWELPWGRIYTVTRVLNDPAQPPWAYVEATVQGGAQPPWAYVEATVQGGPAWYLGRLDSFARWAQPLHRVGHLVACAWRILGAPSSNPLLTWYQVKTTI